MGKRTGAAQHEPEHGGAEQMLVKELRALRVDMKNIVTQCNNLDGKVDILQIELENVSDENKLIRRQLSNSLAVFDNLAFTSEQVADLVSGFLVSVKIRKKITRRVVVENWIRKKRLKVLPETGKFRVTGAEIKRFLKEELVYVTEESATKRASIQKKVDNYFL